MTKIIKNLHNFSAEFVRRTCWCDFWRFRCWDSRINDVVSIEIGLCDYTKSEIMRIGREYLRNHLNGVPGYGRNLL